MNEPDRSHSDRLEILERRCARLRIWCALLSAGALTACLSSALKPSSGIIEARGFVVVGPDGAVRARLGGDDSLSARGLALYGEDREPVAFLSVVDGKQPSRRSAILHLSTEDEDTKTFTAMTTSYGVGCCLSDDHRSIESWVKAGRSGIHFTTSEGKEESPSSKQVRESEAEGGDVMLMRLDVVGDRPSMEGLTPAGDSVFRNP